MTNTILSPGEGKQLNLVGDPFTVKVTGSDNDNKNENEMERVCFGVGNKQLTNITYSRIEADVRRYSNIFNIMWSVSEKVENPFAKDIEYFKQVIEKEV